MHRAEGMGIKAIARQLGMARNTVREALVEPSHVTGADVGPTRSTPVSRHLHILALTYVSRDEGRTWTSSIVSSARNP